MINVGVIGVEEPLLATCWTTAGDAAPPRGDERSPLRLRARIEAAAHAGFRGFGITHVDLMQAQREYGGLAGIRAMFDDHGMKYREVEFLSDWWTTGPERDESDKVRRGLLAAATELGARHVKIGPDFADGPWDFDRWALPKRAERHRSVPRMLTSRRRRRRRGPDHEPRNQ